MHVTISTDPYQLAKDNGLVYSGDGDICAGGMFYSTADVKYGYASALRTIDLDSACGFRGAVLIERITVLIEPADLDATVADQLSEEGRASLECCGMVDTYLEEESAEVRTAMLIECAADYGRYDPEQPAHVWDDRPAEEIIQVEPADPYWGPMAHNGMTASKRVLEENLLGYLQHEYLRSLA